MSINGPTINWIGGTFYLSVGQLARTSKNPDYTKFMLDLANRYNFALRGTTPHDLINADEQCVGALYEELYARKRLPGMIMPLRQRLDYTLPYLTQTPAPPKLTWWWCDSLFMAPEVMTRMSALTGDPKYINAMNTQWWRLYDLLYDKTEHLYFRDERFLTRISKNGKNLLGPRQQLGSSPASRASSTPCPPTTPRATSSSPSSRKWPPASPPSSSPTASGPTLPSSTPTTSKAPNPPAPVSTPTPSPGASTTTSSTAPTFERAVVQKGWAALNTAILPNGLIGYVQKTGDQPVPSLTTDTGLYGTGAFLLAGLQVMNLSTPTAAFPSPNPRPTQPRACAPQTRRHCAPRSPPTPPKPNASKPPAARRRIQSRRHHRLRPRQRRRTSPIANHRRPPHCPNALTANGESLGVPWPGAGCHG